MVYQIQNFVFDFCLISSENQNKLNIAFRAKKNSGDESDKNEVIHNSTDNNSDNNAIVENDEICSLSNYKSFEISDKKKEIMLKKVNNIRAKKREQKMKHKPSINSDQIIQITSSEESKTIDDSITPQKRKGTIWKILFPDKDIEDRECDLERLVCSQVENQIAKDLKVIECFKQLKAFESSPEGLNMSKVEYTKKKNRISAQLSRERREAIMHSLINVCITNIKAKKDLNADVEEVKHLLKDTLCSDCKQSLRGKPNPTTINRKVA
jgi:hypothetical protein